MKENISKDENLFQVTGCALKENTHLNEELACDLDKKHLYLGLNAEGVGDKKEQERAVNDFASEDFTRPDEGTDILSVQNLSISFDTYAGEVKAIRDISFSLKAKETLAIVGESGCGKSITAKSIIRLLPKEITKIGKESKILFKEKDILSFSTKELSELRGGNIGMIFQDPMTSLNPTMKVGDQIDEALKIHRKLGKKQRQDEVERLLKLVNIPHAKERAKQYPHQFSGGQRQRIGIAIALACHPQILIADEITTALDVTIQADIMDLLDELKAKLETAVILITHDLGIVYEHADKIQVMYAGIIVEKGSVKEIFEEAKHPYTWALLKSIPTLNTEHKKKLYSISGTPPNLLKEIIGCPFAPRCEYRMQICSEAMPKLSTLSPTHNASCWLMHENAPKLGGQNG